MSITENLPVSEYVTIAFNVPHQDADRVRLAMGQAGAGKIGNYAFCSFSSKGVGRFLPLNNAQPHIGTINQPEEVIEEKIETICHRDQLEFVIATIKKTHPYETMVIDIYPIYKIGIKL